MDNTAVNHGLSTAFISLRILSTKRQLQSTGSSTAQTLLEASVIHYFHKTTNATHGYT
ncbi:MAG: hypothetical protein ACP5R4_11445 [Armatimonadota bacterium]